MRDSVPEVVRDIITRNRSIYDCMKMDVINYTALALKIQPDVERQLRNPVNLNTIVVAIKRYADSFEQKEDIKSESVLKNARLSLTDGILDIKFSTNDMDKKEAASLLDKFEQYDSDYEFRIIAEDLEDIRRMFDSFPSTKNFFSTGLAKIKILIPQEQNRSDTVSYVAEILHNNGIELQNASFWQDDIILVLREEDASKAYEILRAEITR
ncbi:MAG: ACT domain-containing protein [Nitrosopumilaceae archaeon]|nr:ACT domain-containing protein [Nitrosopumilaceae archaeon]NDF25936.1 ACT domain-containing protein [Nitrososphaerota archaeon]